MSGRKKDPIWNHYIEKSDKAKTGVRAVCKNCNKELQGLVQRLKNHHIICKNVVSVPAAGKYFCFLFIISELFLEILFVTFLNFH